jgi:hypothetical protein
MLEQVKSSPYSIFSTIKKFSLLDWSLIFCALIIDFIGFILSLLVAGALIANFISFLANIFFAIILFIQGKFSFSGKRSGTRLLVSSGSFIIEEIPFINALPGTVIFVASNIFIYYLEQREEENAANVNISEEEIENGTNANQEEELNSGITQNNQVGSEAEGKQQRPNETTEKEEKEQSAEEPPQEEPATIASGTRPSKSEQENLTQEEELKNKNENKLPEEKSREEEIQAGQTESNNEKDKTITTAELEDREKHSKQDEENPDNIIDMDNLSGQENEPADDIGEKDLDTYNKVVDEFSNHGVEIQGEKNS